MQLEKLGKIQRIAESYRVCDLGDALLACFQKLCGAVEPQGADVFGYSDLHLLFEQSGDVLFVIGEIVADLLDAKRGITEMLVDIRLDKCEIPVALCQGGQCAQRA